MVEDIVEHVVDCLGTEGPFPHKHLVDDDSQAPPIQSKVVAAELVEYLRSYIVGCADYMALVTAGASANQ